MKTPAAVERLPPEAGGLTGPSGRREEPAAAPAVQLGGAVHCAGFNIPIEGVADRPRAGPRPPAPPRTSARAASSPRLGRCRAKSASAAVARAIPSSRSAAAAPRSAGAGGQSPGSCNTVRSTVPCRGLPAEPCLSCFPGRRLPSAVVLVVLVVRSVIPRSRVDPEGPEFRCQPRRDRPERFGLSASSLEARFRCSRSRRGGRSAFAGLLAGCTTTFAAIAADRRPPATCPHRSGGPRQCRLPAMQRP